MPRAKSYETGELLQRALDQFWAHGFHASSMDDLVKATGVSRHGIYTEYKGKQGLFLACFAQYRAKIVDPAFDRVEQPGAGLAEIEAYFEQQIALADSVGLPGPGCFVGNAMTEVAPHDPAVQDLVAAHQTRLRIGFANALQGAAPKALARAEELADVLVVFAAGLWAMSRIVPDANVLRRAVRVQLKSIAGDLSCS